MEKWQIGVLLLIVLVTLIILCTIQVLLVRKRKA